MFITIIQIDIKQISLCLLHYIDNYLIVDCDIRAILIKAFVYELTKSNLWLYNKSYWSAAQFELIETGLFGILAGYANKKYLKFASLRQKTCITFETQLYLPLPDFVYGSSGAIKGYRRTVWCIAHTTCHIPHAARCQLPWHANRCEKSALRPHERSEINCRAVVSYVPGIGNVVSERGQSVTERERDI